jgi:hypothetical protein
MSRGRDKAEEFLPRAGNATGKDPVHIPDTITIDPVHVPDNSATDTIQIPLPFPVILTGPDVLPATVTDSITVNQSAPISTLQDSITVSNDTTIAVSGSLHGEPGIQLPSGSLSAAQDSAKKSVWDRIDLRVKQIEAVKIESAARDARIDKSDGGTPVKAYNYDASFLMSGDSELFFFHKSIFPSADNETGNKPGMQPVFVQAGPSAFNNASLAYQTYLQKDTFSADLSGQEDGATQYSTAWIPVLVLTSFLLLAWIKLIYVQFLTPVLISAFNYKESVKLFHGKNAPAQNAFLILQIIFAINSGLFLLFVSGFFNLKMPDIKPSILFLISSASIVFLYTFKFGALRFLGFLFEKKKLFSEYRYNISLYNKIYGLLLLPMVIGLLYGGETLYTTIIYTGLLMGIIFYFLQLIRGLEIIVRKDFSVFYLILYLCAFEIFPILVLYKLVDVFLL